MKTSDTKHGTISSIVRTMFIALASTAGLAAAHDATVTPPAVPFDLQVEAGNEAYLAGHGVGTQNYVCVPSSSGVTWALFTPQATLFSDSGEQITTHFFSPN